jgi:hypothetical protein
MFPKEIDGRTELQLVTQISSDAKKKRKISFSRPQKNFNQK